MITLAELRERRLAELEELYLEARSVQIPTGWFRGHHLTWLNTPGARHPLWRPLETAMFQLTPFGVDFTARRWFFWSRRVAAGSFTPHPGPSRWRDTETVCLEYGVSRLPGPVRGLLYDEVKPLGEDLCLCIGGINAERDSGDHFFFALERAGS